MRMVEILTVSLRIRFGGLARQSGFNLTITGYNHTIRRLYYAPVAQLDRVPGYEPGGREFESLRARHNYQ